MLSLGQKIINPIISIVAVALFFSAVLIGIASLGQVESSVPAADLHVSSSLHSFQTASCNGNQQQASRDYRCLKEGICEE
jgi:hypothetical protein